jgi:hypothetical protein
VFFGFGVKLHGLESNIRPKHIDFFNLIFKKIYDLKLFHIGPKDIALTIFARHLS